MHNSIMRTHSKIIDDLGGYQALSEKIGIPAERVRFWHKRDSIPNDWWLELDRQEIVSLHELSWAPDQKRQSA